MKNKKHLKTLKLLGIILFVFGFFMIVNISYAFDPLAIAGKSIIDIFSWGITIVLYILSTIFASILMIGGWVFDWTLNLNSAIMQNPAVRVGWPIARDITNLGFVLLILIIAFSTILRMGEFTAKKALPKLIIAALLINFSLLFAGMFLDFTGILTNFFINKGITGAGDGVGISQAIIGMMGIVTILQPPATLGAESFATFGAGMLNFITNLFFINIITAVTAITMWAMAIMFLIRYVMLGLLIIVMPLAILAWVIGRGEWSEWFTNFTKYALFAPISSLFIYLAIATASEFGAMQISAKQAGVAPGLSSITDNIGSMIMIIAILMFGLGIAEKASGAGGKIAVKMAEGAIKGITKGTLAGGFKALGGKKMADWASKAGAYDKEGKPRSALWRGVTRPFRQMGAETSAGLKKYPGIMTGLTEGIAEGWGGKGRALRMKEEKEFEEKDKKIATKEKNEKLRQAKTDELAKIDSEVKADSNKLQEAYARLKLVESGQKENKATLEGGIALPPDVRERMEQAKKEYDEEAENLLKQTIELEEKIKNAPSQKEKTKKELKDIEKGFEKEEAGEINKELLAKMKKMEEKLGEKEEKKAEKEEKP